MFKIINNETATVEQLAQGYVEIENYLPELDKNRQSVNDKLVDLQQAAMSGKNQNAKITTVKNELLDYESKKEACYRGLIQIKERIAAQLPKEASVRIKELEIEAKALKEEESELYRAFFTACAKAIAIREKIKGIDYYYDAHAKNGNEMRERNPQLEVTAYYHMSNDDSRFFCEQTEKARKANGDFVPVERRLGKITNELHTLRTMTADYNPETEVEKVLATYR